MADLLSFKCKNCGASVSFDIESQKMKCPHCDSLFSVYDFKDSKSVWQEDEADDIRLFECDSCGGHIATNNTATSARCPYCDGNVVVRGRVTGKNRPDYIIPFKLDKAQAIRQLRKNLKNKKFLPKIFKSDAKIKECRGIYVPFWVFSTKAEYVAVASAVSGDTTIDLTYRVKAPVRLLPVDCSEKIPNDITESLEPFDFSKAMPFMPSYLAGHFADMHDADKDECIKHATKRITEGIKKKIIEDVSKTGKFHKFKELYPHFHDSYAMYALFPVWIFSVSWKKRRYTFAVNGQTGKFVGNLPCSYTQLFAMFLKIFGGIFAIGSIILLIASLVIK